jgi:hypothetical protein
VDEFLHVEGSCSDEERKRWMTLFLDIQKSEMTFFFASFDLNTNFSFSHTKHFDEKKFP